MNVDRLIQRKISIWGAVVGALCALLIILVSKFLRNTNGPPSLAKGATSIGAEPPVTSRPGDVLTLTEGEAGMGIPDTVSTRGRMQLFVVAAHLANDEVEKAVATADEMEAGVDRDSALSEIAEKIVPRRLTMSLEVLPVDPDQRSLLTRNLLRVVDLAKRASSSELSARLLVRAAILKRAMDKSEKGRPNSADPRLNPEEPLTTVIGLARSAPANPPGSASAIGTAIPLTALLTIIGFAVGQLIQPVLQATGSILASHVLGSLHPTYSKLLGDLHNQATGGLGLKPAAQLGGGASEPPNEGSSEMEAEV